MSYRRTKILKVNPKHQKKAYKNETNHSRRLKICFYEINI
nr:MAG TPA: hypothetical protein [Caudoviricetes sp.]